MKRKGKVRPKAGTVIDSTRSYKKYFILGPFFKIFEAIFELIMPIFMSTIISQGLAYGADGQVVGANWGLIAGYAGGILAMTIFGFCSTLVCQYMASIASQGTGTNLRNRLFKHVQELTSADLERYGVSNAVNVITNDTNQVQQGVALLIRLAIRAPFLVIGAIVASLILDWKSGLVFLGLAICIFAFMLVFLPRTSKGYTRVQSKVDKLSRHTDDTLAGARVIRAFNREDTEISKFSSASKEYEDESLKIARITSLLSPVTTFAINAVIVILVALGAFAGILNEGATVESIADENGRIVALVNYLNQILQAVVVVTNLIISFTRAWASTKRCNVLLSIEPSFTDKGERKDVTIERGGILFALKNVSLNYPGSDTPAISGLNLEIHKGDRIGIIGGTGSGKSTVLNLLLRFHQATQGEVDYKGADIKEYSLKSFYSEIGYVPQKPTVFKGTIRSNLLLSNPQANEEDMKQALRLALCDFAFENSDGLDREIDEGAKDLSGGQRQRLAIAMALVRKPQILVMDDSFSALDYLSEKKLRDNLLSLGSDLTQIIVSERVSSLQGSTAILVLDKGQVESLDAPDKLYGRSKVYTEICDVQRGEAR